MLQRHAEATAPSVQVLRQHLATKAQLGDGGGKNEQRLADEIDEDEEAIHTFLQRLAGDKCEHFFIGDCKSAITAEQQCRGTGFYSGGQVTTCMVRVAAQPGIRRFGWPERHPRKERLTTAVKAEQKEWVSTYIVRKEKEDAEDPNSTVASTPDAVWATWAEKEQAIASELADEDEGEQRKTVIGSFGKDDTVKAAKAADHEEAAGPHLQVQHKQKWADINDEEQAGTEESDSDMSATDLYHEQVARQQNGEVARQQKGETDDDSNHTNSSEGDQDEEELVVDTTFDADKELTETKKMIKYTIDYLEKREGEQHEEEMLMNFMHNAKGLAENFGYDEEMEQLLTRVEEWVSTHIERKTTQATTAAQPPQGRTRRRRAWQGRKWHGGWNWGGNDYGDDKWKQNKEQDRAEHDIEEHAWMHARLRFTGEVSTAPPIYNSTG